VTDLIGWRDMVTRLVQAPNMSGRLGLNRKQNSGSRAKRLRWADRRRFNMSKRNGGYKFQIFMLIMLL